MPGAHENTSFSTNDEAQRSEYNLRDLLYKLWDFFSSMKIGLFLLLLIAIASISGTLVPQNEPPQRYRFYSFYRLFGLTDVYHSWWFITLLFLLSMNLLVCSLNRWQPIMKAFFKPNRRVNDNYLRRLKCQYTVTRRFNGREMAEQLRKVLQSHGYRFFHEEEKDKIYIYCDKGRLGLWGSLITHLSFLLIIIGALISSIFSWEGQIAASVPSVFDIAQVNWVKPPRFGFEENYQIRVDDFKILYRQDGTVEDWISRLTVLQNDQEVLTRDIEVNQPLDYKGVKIYQAFYGHLYDVEVTNLTTKQTISGEIEAGMILSIPNTNLYLVNIRTLDPVGNRIFYEVWRGPERVYSSIAGINQAQIIGDNEGIFIFKGVKKYTGLTVRKDPGVWIVWFASGFLVLGMLISFYLPNRKIWGIITQNGQVMNLEIGGFAQKNKLGFEREFTNIINSID